MILIQNGTLVFPGGSRKADLLIEGEKIARIGTDLDIPAGCSVVNASGKLVFPGFIDAHTHFDLHVAGTVTIDDFASGTKAAAAGGTTTIIDFGTAYPGETLNEGLDNWFRKAEAGCSCDYGFHQTITEWNDSVSAQIPDMIERGASTFKIYMTYDTKIDDEAVFKVLQRLKECGTTTGCHCENSGMIDALRQEFAADPEKKAAVSSHYLTRPAAAEAEAIGRYCHLAEVADEPVIDVHLTCEEGLEEIRAARRRGQKVYAETCPQYLVMDDSLYEKETFEAVTKARASVGQIKLDASTLTPEKMKQFEQAQGQLSEALGKLMVVAERYPELKANENFHSLQIQLEGTENRINEARQQYNAAVQDYNQTVRRFPNVIFAGMFGFNRMEKFEAAAGAEKAPEVNFN